MKKALSFVLILVLALSLCVPVFAENTATDPGTITITNALKGETYNIYKLFDFTWDGGNAYSYTLPADSSWTEFFTAGAGATYFTFDSTTRAVTPKDALGTEDSGDGVRAFADAAMAYLADAANNITADKSIEAAADGSITFENLGYGYYLIDTTMGTVCVLDSNSENLNVTDKTSIPAVDKQVQEDDKEGEGWTDDYANAPIGQSVNFRVKIENVYKRENLVYHDAMSKGLTLDADSIAVYMREDTNTDPVYLTNEQDYFVTIHEKNSEGESIKNCNGKGCTFEVAFSTEYLQNLKSSRNYLVVTYSAELNEGATVTTPAAGQDLTQGGNPNDGSISYGSAQWSTWDHVTVHTWPLKVFKYTGTNKTPLAGAEFVLAKPIVSEGKTMWAYVKAVDANKVPLTGVKDPAETDTYGFPVTNGWTMSAYDATLGYAPVPEDALRFTSSNLSTELIQINGLDAQDEYVLIETEAPEGYNKLSGPIVFHINDSSANGATVGYIKIDKKEGLNSQIEVENKTGTELPSTGGTGTTMFYIIGGVLAVGAVVLLVTKKRMGSES